MLTAEHCHDYHSVAVPALPAVPSLTTEDEQHYLYWLARCVLTGQGAVIEIGTWYGASAAYLAAGLRDGNPGSSLYCYDRFVARANDADKARDQGITLPPGAPGGDTTLVVRQYLASVYHNVHLVKTEIDQLTWLRGPVALIHLDAPKRWQELLHVLRIFSNYLISHTTIVVVQDFFLPRAYVLPLVFGFLEDSFELIHIPTHKGTTATYVFKQPYNISDVEDIYQWSVSTVELIMARTINAVRYKEHKKLLKLSLASYYLDRDKYERMAFRANHRDGGQDQG